MKKIPLTVLVVVVLLFVGGGVVVWRWPRETAPTADASTTKTDAPATQSAKKETNAPQTTARSPLTTAEKAARIEQIKRDYDEVRAKATADYAAAGTSFPGGLNAFLRQLALLERELHKDYAVVLSPRELEDLEMRETVAGQTVQRLLGDTTATDEQRRAVFRLQREFDDKFALTFDIQAPTLLLRETERQATQRAIGAALGNDELFAAWLRGEGDDFASYREFLGQQAFAPSVAFDLWRAKNDYTLRRLELNARQDLSAAQTQAAQTALAKQVRARVQELLGPVVFPRAAGTILGWLPPPR